MGHQREYQVMPTSKCDLDVDNAMEMLNRLLSDPRNPEVKVGAASADPQAVAILVALLTEISSAAVEAVAEQRNSTYSEAVEWTMSLARNSRRRALAASSSGPI
jgi:hypothetical protein